MGNAKATSLLCHPPISKAVAHLHDCLQGLGDDTGGHLFYCQVLGSSLATNRGHVFDWRDANPEVRRYESEGQGFESYYWQNIFLCFISLNLLLLSTCFRIRTLTT